MLSKIAYAFSVGLMLYASFVFYPQWKNKGTESIIGWDVAGYYWYLPSIFIYKDIKHQSFKDTILAKYGSAPEFPGYKYDNGNYILKYASGMAVMYLPAFAVAHFLAPSFGYPRDGFSPPYQLAIQVEGILFAFLGLWYLRKLFLKFYDDRVVAIVLIAIVFGSNYLNYGAISLGMSHSWLFTVYVFLLLNTYYFYKQPKYKYAARIGLLIGLATLTRPTEIISCLIPLLWGIERVSLAAFKQRFEFLGRHLKKIIVTAICGILVASIQLIYWKYVSGHWFVYSYQQQGFSWLFQNFMNYAFSFHSGWLIYSPMLIFAFIGIYSFIKNGRNKLAILSFFLLNFYIVSAWDIWWYGGRAMIQSYPILFFPFAAFTETALKSKALKWILAPVFLIFIYFNIWITYHYHKGNLYDCDTMSKEYFFRVVGRWSAPEETIKLRDTRELFEGVPKNMQLLYENDFENDTTLYCPLPAIQGKRSAYIDKDHRKAAKFSSPYSAHTSKWIRAQATFRSVQKEWGVWAMPHFNIFFLEKGNRVKAYGIRVHRFLDDNTTKDIFVDIKVPKGDFDTVGVELSDEGSDKQLLMDNLKIWSFDE